MENYCKNCNYFEKIFVPKYEWHELVKKAKEMHPNLNDKECAALANHVDLWDKKESGYGHCNYHNIEDSIPEYMSCLKHETRTII
jgi:hypothetical protein